MWTGRTWMQEHNGLLCLMQTEGQLHTCIILPPTASFSLSAVIERPTDGAVLSAARGRKEKKKRRKVAGTCQVRERIENNLQLF